MIEYVARAVENDLKKQTGEVKQKLKWAVAGRNEDRLAKALITATLNTPGFDHNKVDILICDVKDDSSVKKMVSQTRVVLNCVGPMEALPAYGRRLGSGYTWSTRGTEAESPFEQLILEGPTLVR